MPEWTPNQYGSRYYCYLSHLTKKELRHREVMSFCPRSYIVHSKVEARYSGFRVQLLRGPCPTHRATKYCTGDLNPDLLAAESFLFYCAMFLGTVETAFLSTIPCYLLAPNT